MKEFYAVVYNRNYTTFTHFFDIDLNVMISAGYLLKKKGFRDPYIPPQTKLLFLDSGGFQMLSRFKEFPFTPQEYASFVTKVRPHFYASMDYPCEPELREKCSTTVKQQIEKTIENNIALMELETPAVLIPVIQGWKPPEYVYCIDRMREQGLLSNYMAVGSLCVRKSIKTAEKVIQAVRKNMPKATKLHGFGLKISAFKNQYIFNNLYSSDSIAWLYNKQFGRCTVFSGTRLIELDNRSKLNDVEKGRLSLRSYLEYVNYLMEKQQAQTNLKQHVEVTT